MMKAHWCCGQNPWSGPVTHGVDHEESSVSSTSHFTTKTKTLQKLLHWFGHECFCIDTMYNVNTR